MTTSATEVRDDAKLGHGQSIADRHSPATGRPRRRQRVVRDFPTEIVVSGCVALHLLAATVIYRDMARDLYSLFDASPRLLVLERGFVRLTAISVFLPPVIPTALVAGTALWLGRLRRKGEAARWLALALVPLAADSVLRAVGVAIAPPPGNLGDLLDLPSRFSIGPRLALDLAGVHPGPGLAYWAVVCTVGAAASAWCVARALLAAESAERLAAGHGRRRTTSSVEVLQAATTTLGMWIALAFAGQVALPWAAQLFLRTFG